MKKRRRICYGIAIVLLVIACVTTFCQCSANNSNIKSNSKMENENSSVNSEKTEMPSTVSETSEQTKLQEEDSNLESSEAEVVENSNGGIIYLTFDDGPSIENTTQILDILKEKNVKATFFIVNYSDELENIVKRQYSDGHTIGLHGYSHTYSQIYCSIDALMNNFLMIQERIAKTTSGYTSKIIRFPGGSSNTVSRKYCRGIMSQAVNKVTESGFIYFDWNVSSGDANAVTCNNAENIYNNTISTLKPRQENVVLMHDSAGHSATRDIVGKVIDYGKENGYIFKAITETTTPVRHGVNN